MSAAAEAVMAVTYKLVQQAQSGQWREVPHTLAERRAMLDQLAMHTRPEDQPWLAALRAAVAESDAAVAAIAPRDDIGTVRSDDALAANAWRAETASAAPPDAADRMIAEIRRTR
ncbi:MAG TPA: hypothetical protein VK025_14280 [Steroidobacter sp.]|jgi:hypothetical protein|nr:hypothetical protein [Steroidobacteraceae bacterium]HLS82563.1 hypothetical protein [Steroidobacter sp.]